MYLIINISSLDIDFSNSRINYAAIVYRTDNNAATVTIGYHGTNSAPLTLDNYNNNQLMQLIADDAYLNLCLNLSVSPDPVSYLFAGQVIAGPFNYNFIKKDNI